MMRRFVLAKLRGASDLSGIILPDMGEPGQLMQRAAELLAHLDAGMVRPHDVELLPYFPPERDRLQFDPKAA